MMLVVVFLWVCDRDGKLDVSVSAGDLLQGDGTLDGSVLIGDEFSPATQRAKRSL